MLLRVTLPAVFVLLSRRKSYFHLAFLASQNLCLAPELIPYI